MAQSAAGVGGHFEHGRGWYCYPTKRFKTLSVYAYWLNPLMPGKASQGALVPQILRRASQSWDSTMLVERRLEELYGASFRAEVGKIGDQQLLSFQFDGVNGRFLPGRPDMLAEGLNFVQEMMYRPRMVDGRFDAEIFAQEKVLLRRQIQALINDKGQYALNRLVEVLADGQRFGINRLGTLEEAEQLTLEGVWQTYAELQKRRPLVWFVVGDVDPEAVQRAFAAASEMAEPQESLATMTTFRPRDQARTVIDHQPVQQGKVNLGYATGITAKDPDYPALVMYVGILGGFPHSKLFMNVREKASLAYYAYARLDAVLGLMMVGAGIEFGDFDAALDIIHQQVELMRQGAISDDEMQFTLSGLTNEIRAENDSPGRIVGRQLERLLVGGGPSGPELIQALSKVTKEDVVRVAQQIRLDATYFLTTDQAGESVGAAQ